MKYSVIVEVSSYLPYLSSFLFKFKNRRILLFVYFYSIRSNYIFILIGKELLYSWKWKEKG